MSKTLFSALAFTVLLCATSLCAGSPVDGFNPPATRLVVPQSNAFGILGHSCGGIQEQVYAAGFHFGAGIDPGSGLPSGYAYLSTRCSTGGIGGHTVTYSAWVSAAWDFTGNLISASTLSTIPTINPTLVVNDRYHDIVYNASNAAYLVVPVPAAPTGVTAVQAGDQFQVSWIANTSNPAAIMSSTLTAVPLNSPAPTIMTTINGSTNNGTVGPLQPQTTYQITVSTATIGGSSPASFPIKVSTQAASVAPSAPTGLSARWQIADPQGNNDTLIATWNAAVPGNSPVDQYEVTINGSDGGGTLTQSVPGDTLTANFIVNWIPNWTVKVRAHNAAGWSPWSNTVSLGGL